MTIGKTYMLDKFGAKWHRNHQSLLKGR